jgi:hypothetical protein
VHPNKEILLYALNNEWFTLNGLISEVDIPVVSYACAAAIRKQDLQIMGGA